MIEWAAIGWKVKPFAVVQAKRWWNRDVAKNLSRRVLDELENDGALAPGMREQLVVQWLSVRDDPMLSRVVAQLLADPEPAIEPLVEVRLLELLHGLPLILGEAGTAARLAAAVLRQLGAAQKTPDAVSRADHRRTHNKLDLQNVTLDKLRREVGDGRDALVEQLRVQHDSLRDAIERPTASPAQATQALVFATELGDDQQRILSALRRTHARLAAQLAGMLDARGPEALDELLTVPPSWAGDPPFEFWSAVSQLANAAVRFSTGRDAALREADDPCADRPAALIQAAQSAFAEADDVTGNRLYSDAEKLEKDHPSVLLCAAQRAVGHAERLKLADRVKPRTDRQRAWQQAERALALLGLGNVGEATAAAAASVALNPHGAGLEAKHVVTIFAAVTASPERVGSMRDLADAASWFIDVADKNREGRPAIAGIAASRAAIALAVAGDHEQVRHLLDRSAASAGELRESEAAQHFGEAAMIIGDPHRALRVLATATGEHGRVQRAAAAACAGVDVAAAVAELDELVNSDDPRVAHHAVAARFAAANDPEIALPDVSVAGMKDGARMLAVTKAVRAATLGDLPEAQRLVARFDDPASLELRIELAEQAGEKTKALRLAERLVKLEDTGVQRLRLAALRRRAGDLGRGRRDALEVANDDRNVAGLRRRAFSMAAQFAGEEGHFRDLETVADAWLAFDATAENAVWCKAIALTRQRRHAEAVELVDAAGVVVQHESHEAMLAEALSYGVPDPIQRLARLNALSESRQRPERLEFALITATLQVPSDCRPGGELEQRIRATFAEFCQRFPESSLMQAVSIDEDDPAGSLLQTLERLAPAAADRDQRIADAHTQRRLGRTPTAAVAALTGTSTIGAFADGSPLPLAAADPATRDEERRAAERALDGAAASWDATAIAVVAGLPNHVGEQIRGLLAASQVGQATFDDVAQRSSVLHPHSQGAAGHDRRSEALHRAALFVPTLPLTADMPGGPMGGDEQLTETLTDEDIPLPFRALVSAISVGRAAAVPLYSDDRAVRALARGKGVDAFGTTALLEVLAQREDWSTSEVASVREELAGYGAWGLGLTPDDVVQMASANGFIWHSGLEAIFSDVLAHHTLPRGLLDHAAATLLAVSAHAPERLAEWAANVVNLTGYAMNQTRLPVVRPLLARVLDFTAAAEPEVDAARARVIRALRALPGLIVMGGGPDPLLVLVGALLQDLDREGLAAAGFRGILRQVDVRDRELLIGTFVRDAP